MAVKTAGAPWTECTFAEYLYKIDFPQWLLDIAVSNLAQRTELDITVMNKMEKAFADYMDHDFSYASVARMITAQGYETVNNANAVIETYLNGRPTQITLTACGIPMPEGRRRVIAFGPWNIRVSNGIERYPFFAAGLIKAIDPMFNGRSDLRFRNPFAPCACPEPRIPGVFPYS